MSNPCVQQFTYFSITINNPDDNDYLIVRNPNEKYIKQCVWTNEKGTEGTPHVQMWVRLYRNNSLSLVKKLYPRGHIKGIAKDEYNENSHAYAQKDDETTAGSHVITTNDTPRDAVDITQTLIQRLQTRMSNPTWYWQYKVHLLQQDNDISQSIASEEENMVREKPYLAKMFVGSTYKQIKERFFEVLWDRNVSEQITNKQTNTGASTPTTIMSSD